MGLPGARTYFPWVPSPPDQGIPGTARRTKGALRKWAEGNIAGINPKPKSGDFETPGSVGIRVPAVPDTDFGPNVEAVTANPKHKNHLTAAYPPNPLYPPLFSEDGEAPTFSRSRQGGSVHGRTLASLARTLWAGGAT